MNFVMSSIKLIEGCVIQQDDLINIIKPLRSALVIYVTSAIGGSAEISFKTNPPIMTSALRNRSNQTEVNF